MTNVGKQERHNVLPAEGFVRFFKITIVSFGEKLSMTIEVNIKE